MRVYRYVCVVRCVFDLILLLHDHAMYFYCVLEVKSEKTFVLRLPWRLLCTRSTPIRLVYTQHGSRVRKTKTPPPEMNPVPDLARWTSRKRQRGESPGC